MKSTSPASTFIGSAEATLGELVHRDKLQFLIPYNQRPWSWKASHLDQFWKDINTTADKHYDCANEWKKRSSPLGNPHFFGAFVFIEKSENEWLVQDGQQRLTASTILVAALRERCIDLRDKTSNNQLKTNCLNLCSALYEWLNADAKSGDFLARLNVDSQYQDLFDSYVLKPTTSTEREEMFSALGLDLSQLPHHRKIKISLDHVKEIIDASWSGFSEMEVYSAASAVWKTLNDHFLCICVKVKYESFALEVFQCLNARGLPLNEADKVKNELFVRSNPSDHDKIKEGWDKIYHFVPYGHIAGFLRIRHLALIGDCPENKLYEKVRDDEIEKNSSIADLTKAWVKDAELLQRVALESAYNFKAETKDVLGEFKTLRISLGWIFLLSAAKRYLPSAEDKFRSAARLALNFCFRTLTISGKDTSVLENALSTAARKLNNGGSLKDIATHFLGVSPDVEFEKDFLAKSEKRVKIQFYILYSMEKHLAGGSGLIPLPHGEKQHIEHILPKNFSKAKKRQNEWSWARAKPEDHKLYLNRLGNLCVLERDINMHISNFEFEAKRSAAYPKGSEKIQGLNRKSYEDSQLRLVKELLDTKNYPDWSFEAIAKRQADMAKAALDAWSLTGFK